MPGAWYDSFPSVRGKMSDMQQPPVSCGATKVINIVNRVRCGPQEANGGRLCEVGVELAGSEARPTDARRAARKRFYFDLPA